MRLAFHTVHFSPMQGGSVPLPQVLDAATAAGFHDIGLDLPSIDAYIAGGASLRALRDELATRQLRCSDVLVLVITPDLAAVKAAARHLAQVLDTIPTDLCVAAVLEPIEWRQLVNVLRWAGELFGARGTRLAIEYSPYLAVSTLNDTRRLCSEVGWDRAGVLLDSLHFFRSRTGWDELADLDGTEIALVQFSDGYAARPDDLIDDSRNHRLIPGDGELDLRRFVATVTNTGFDGTVTAEVLSATLRKSDPLQAAQSIRAALAEYWLDVSEPRV